MADRWECRTEPTPGQGKLHWHILFRDHPQVQALASIAQERLARFSDLHFTPRQWLHVTTLIVGFVEDFTATEIDDMIARAHQLLSVIPPIEIVFGKVLYHPEGIVLGIRPDNALSPVFEAVRSATRIATGGDGITERQPWTPHVTLAYSTSVQPARLSPLSGVSFQAVKSPSIASILLFKKAPNAYGTGALSQKFRSALDKAHG